MKLWISTLFVLATMSAQAAQTTFSESLCVVKPVRNVFDTVTNYDGWHQMPGSKFVKEIGTLIQMVKSQGRFVTKTESTTDAYVWVVLQPTNLVESPDRELYPKFILRCKSEWSSSSQFIHTCALDESKKHFGLKRFNSHISAVIDGCGAGKAKVVYDVTIESIDQDVRAIKTAALSKLGPLAPYAAKMFNEELFFRDYFKNLLKHWMQDAR